MIATPVHGRVFTARYRQALAVWPAAVLAIVLATALLNFGLDALSAGVITGLVAGLAYALARRAWRRRSAARPALSLSESGLEIDGLPEIPWRQVAGVEIRAAGGRVGLVVRLTRKPGLMRLSPVWRPEGDQAIFLRLWLLEDPAPEVEAAFRAFLKP